MKTYNFNLPKEHTLTENKFCVKRTHKIVFIERKTRNSYYSLPKIMVTSTPQ